MGSISGKGMRWLPKHRRSHEIVIEVEIYPVFEGSEGVRVSGFLGEF